jgi:dethiobiotin synthetase
VADSSGRLIFVTGTDTGVGKTIVTAALARHYSQLGISVGVMKPVESGVVDPLQLGKDAALLKWAAGCDEPDELIAPYRFKAPLAPDQAAKLEQRTVALGDIVTRARALTSRYQLVLIEGAGGLMVPLAGGLLVADLIKQLEAELLVVTRPDLGTINHTLLTVFAARTMEIPVCGMILNKQPVEPAPAQKNAPHALAALASADLLAVFSQHQGSPKEIVTQLAAELPSQAGYNWLNMKLGLPTKLAST